MDKDPEQRPQSAEEVRSLIGERGRSKLGRTFSESYQGSTNTRRAVLASIAVLSLIAAAILFGTGAFCIQRPSTPLNAEFSVHGTQYESLQLAIQQASDGGTIEILGDGPYRVPGYDAGDKSLRIIASPLSRPVFQPVDEFAKRPFLRSTADLQLERIEVHWPLLDAASKPSSGLRTTASSPPTVES